MLAVNFSDKIFGTIKDSKGNSSSSKSAASGEELRAFHQANIEKGYIQVEES
jgi:hypothetical protein